MSNQGEHGQRGLSIFDDEHQTAEDEAVPPESRGTTEETGNGHEQTVAEQTVAEQTVAEQTVAVPVVRRAQTGTPDPDEELTQVLPVVAQSVDPPAWQETGQRPVLPPLAMTQPGQSGQRVSPPPPLATVRRNGYDKFAVDARLRDLNAAQHALTQQLSTAGARIEELETDLISAHTQLDQAQVPSYASLGGRASAMLRLAEEEAAEMRSVAQRDADEIRDQAVRDATAIKSDAIREADEQHRLQSTEIEQLRSRALTEAEQERSSAQAHAGDVVASAQRESDQRRLAAQQEISELLTGAQREGEQARAAADREVQEARRMLAVDRERLAREAAEHHTSSLAETKRLVEESESRASAAEDRAREASSQAAQGRIAALSEAEGIVTRARREAEQLLTAAHAQAASVTTSADAEKERQVSALKADVDRLAKRRDAITAQLASLRDVVAGFGDDEE